MKRPKLVVLEGDRDVDSDLAVSVLNKYRVTPEDVRVLQKGYLTPEEEVYFEQRYGSPVELMGGFWGSLTKVLKKVPVVGTAISVGEGIADVVRGSKGGDGGASQEELLRLQLQEQQRKNEQIQKYLMIGIPAAALFVILLSRK